VLLLDASAWIAAVDADEAYFDSARKIVFQAPTPLATLDLTFYEVTNAVGARDGLYSDAIDLCRAIAVRCGERIVTADVELVESALGICAEHGLTAYDAAYVAAARRHGWTLVSTDIADLVSKGLAVAPDAADYP
jgi:predicted nucleic acid-binding protein